jgi:hypothetical protein
MRSIVRYTGIALLSVVVALMTAWATLAIYYSNLAGGYLRLGLGGLFALATLAAFLFLPKRGRTMVCFFAVFAIIVVWWFLIPPSNSRNWQPDVAVLPWATIEGNRATIHNIRNADYRSETDYTVRYYDRTFDMAKMQSVDLFLVYWGSPFIAHTMLSFGFEGGDYVCFSIEIRKEVGEEYSAIKGFFKQYELTYIAGDERDLVRLRTNYRGEQVYLYRLRTSIDTARLVFLDYLREMNRFKDRPEWYNALTSNCTTNIRGHTAPYNPNARFDWRIIVNGFIDTLVYERGTVDQSLPFSELKKRSLINKQAQAADKDPQFSRLIREGLPGIMMEGDYGQSIVGYKF